MDGKQSDTFQELPSDEQLVGYTGLGSDEDEDEQPILREENQSNVFLISE